MTTVGEDSLSRLSEEEQQAILYWTETIGVPVFPADTRHKGVHIKDWSEIDFAKIDYRTNLINGVYDNGIAIRTGKTSKGLWLIVLDFDGWNSVIEWFGSWDNIVEASRRTRIEWHQDKDRIHYFLLANKPIPNRKILIKDAYLEIRCEKQVLFAYPSFHKGGNRYAPLNNKAIAELTDSQLSGLQAQIDTLCEGYMSDEDKRKYLDFLHLQTTILGVSQGRHDATKVIINNYYWKYNGEWLELSDEERFERAWKWHLEHCNPPRSREEFERLCKWAKDKFRAKRDELHEKIRDERNNAQSGISRCVSYKINPHEFITGTPDNRLVEIKHTWSEDKNGQWIEKESIKRTFLACKPVRIIKHRNPLSFLELPQKYSIEFRGSELSGNFTIRHKSLPQIIARLKQSETLTDKNLDNAMIAQIKGFEQAGILEENDDLDYTGFFPIDDREIICSNVIIPENIDVEEINTALDFIDLLASTTAYKDRLDLLSHTLLFGLIAPCSFVFKKVKAPWLAWMHNYGSPNAGKTSSAKLALALDGHETDDDYIVSMKHVDTLARMGDTISRTTFPIIADEMELVDKRSGKVNSVITAAIKTAVDHPILRKVLDQNRNSEQIPALSPLIMTSNPPPPFEDAALVKRLSVRHFPTSETHYKDKEAAFYDTEIVPNLFKLHVLGKFRNKFVMNNPAIILDKQLTPFEKARTILKAIYGYAGNRQIPEWFNKELEQTQLEESISDSKEAIISAFESMVIDKTRNLIGLKAFETDQYSVCKSCYDRFDILVSLKLLPFCKVLRGKTTHELTDDYAFGSGIVDEFYRYGITNEQLPNLKAFSDIFGGDVVKSHGKKIAKVSKVKLQGIFDAEVEIETENQKRIVDYDKKT